MKNDKEKFKKRSHPFDGYYTNRLMGDHESGAVVNMAPATIPSTVGIATSGYSLMYSFPKTKLVIHMTAPNIPIISLFFLLFMIPTSIISLAEIIFMSIRNFKSRQKKTARRSGYVSAYPSWFRRIFLQHTGTTQTLPALFPLSYLMLIIQLIVIYQIVMLKKRITIPIMTITIPVATTLISVLLIIPFKISTSYDLF